MRNDGQLLGHIRFSSVPRLRLSLELRCHNASFHVRPRPRAAE